MKVLPLCTGLSQRHRDRQTDKATVRRKSHSCWSFGIPGQNSAGIHCGKRSLRETFPSFPEEEGVSPQFPLGSQNPANVRNGGLEREPPPRLPPSHPEPSAELPFP
ncbi:UNVERIFIED_CONTAM: hypothetical protein K2H54_005343 [Gekko kuhli]